MQTLNQSQVNLLCNILQYAKNNIAHPEARYTVSSNMYLDGIQVHQPPSSKQVLEQARNRANKIEEYEEFLKNIDILLTVVSSFDYASALKDAEFSTEQPKAVKLGELLSTPEKFDNLGKRTKENNE